MLEKQNGESLEKNNFLSNEVEFLNNENRNFKLNNAILLKENENLRNNNQE